MGKVHVVNKSATGIRVLPIRHKSIDPFTATTAAIVAPEFAIAAISIAGLIAGIWYCYENCWGNNAPEDDEHDGDIEEIELEDLEANNNEEPLIDNGRRNAIWLPEGQAPNIVINRDDDDDVDSIASTRASASVPNDPPLNNSNEPSLSILSEREDDGLEEHPQQFMQRHALYIGPKQYRVINDSKQLKARGHRSDVSDWCTSETLSLLIVSECFTRKALFATDPDHSWIVKNNEIVRQTFPDRDLTKEHREAGHYRFTRGNALRGGRSLAVGQSLRPITGKYELVNQGKGKLVLYERDWERATHQKKLGRFTLDDLKLTVEANDRLKLASGHFLMLTPSGTLKLFHHRR